MKKNFISIVLLFLYLSGSSLLCFGQGRVQPPKTKSSSSDQRNSSTSAPNSQPGAETNQDTSSESSQLNIEKGIPSASSNPATATGLGNSGNKGATSLAEASNSPLLTEIYRVGIGDVLDVRFLNSAGGGRSTLFTVIPGGFIDMPVAGGPISVAGLTTDEIQSRIATELKRRAVGESTQISVGVRQYVSHSVLITGLVVSPGMRILRREAVPLYVVLAESQLRNDAGRVVIMRGDSTGQSLDLNDQRTLNTIVVNGDVIAVSSRVQEFYYIGGRINYPGQKPFQSGITLLQAILAAGGTVRQNEKGVEISREGADGRLVTSRFSLKLIKSGEVEDPKLKPGDRIEVLH